MNDFLDGFVFLVDSSLIPSFFSVKNKQEIFKFRKTELFPLNFSRIILLEDKLLVSSISLPHRNASTNGFSSSLSLLSFNRDNDLDLGKLSLLKSSFLSYNAYL
eukprot:TRINITY_DN12018_c0_g1_i1.p2 TRINITY_DN12018_c0_g1~~TRINITY_DN12018_c0_g1_i1.p2  ORF type:complete len:104 (-),score=15.09 TRINITY_DN12018_c0_g1_i1:92-403(-)